MNRTVIVAGAGGFVGSAVVRRLATDGASVVALIRPGGDRTRLENVQCSIDECDIEDDLALIDTVTRHRPDVVINSTSSNGHPTDEASRQRAWRVNAMGTIGLLRALTHVPDARLVQIGSSLEYSPSSRPLSETSPCLPTTVRGVSKLAATLAVHQWSHEHGRDAAVLRLFSAYGHRQQPERLIPTLIRCAHTGEPFPMVDVTSRRDLVWVDDVAEACVRSVSVASPECPVVNLGTGVEHSVTDVLRAVEAVTDRPIKVTEAGRSRQTHDVEHWVADTTLCRETLGWVPPTTLHEGLTKLVGSR